MGKGCANKPHPVNSFFQGSAQTYAGARRLELP
jgi:hypothetical protein